MLNERKASWRLGAGFHHQSNGNTSLPNQGLNTFLVSLSRHSGLESKKKESIDDNSIKNKNFEKSIENYLSFRSGFGINVLSEMYNDKKPVYTLAASYGKILNKTFKLGVGFYYRYYDSFNTFIKNDQE